MALPRTDPALSSQVSWFSNFTGDQNHRRSLETMWLRTSTPEILISGTQDPAFLKLAQVLLKQLLCGAPFGKHHIFLWDTRDC